MFINFLLAFLLVCALLMSADWCGKNCVLQIFRNVTMFVFVLSYIGTAYLIVTIG